MKKTFVVLLLLFSRGALALTLAGAEGSKHLFNSKGALTEASARPANAIAPIMRADRFYRPRRAI